ncbi:MAG: GNAT family N-acetyltransferase [Pseudomonadota bacterium]
MTDGPVPARPVATTGRLRLREFVPGDAAFVATLFNDTAFLRFIGDRGVRSRADGARWIAKAAFAHYREHGFGLYVVERTETGAALGVAGLIRRDGLQHPDLGFAFLPEHRRRGYATEAARAVLRRAREHHGLDRILAITQTDNTASIATLKTLGFAENGATTLPGEKEPVACYLWCAESAE